MGGTFRIRQKGQYNDNYQTDISCLTLFKRNRDSTSRYSVGLWGVRQRAIEITVMDMGTTAMDMATTSMDMDMGTMNMATTMAMDMGSTTVTTAMNMATYSSGMASSATTSMAMGSMAMGNMAMGSSSMGSMSMASSTAASMSMSMSCSMSMLWNWTTKDVCFISSQWKTSTKALFGGTCVGVFFLLISIVWWRRLLYEYQQQIASIRTGEVAAVYQIKGDASLKTIPESYINTDIPKNNYALDLLIPLAQTLKHTWFTGINENLCVVQGDKVYIYPSIWEHILYTVGDTMEWSVHHVIMLLFMYFNGYVFISCMLGAGFGWLLFNYKSCGKIDFGQVIRRCCL